MATNFEEYANESFRSFAGLDAVRRNSLVDAVADDSPEFVLDLGCGGGHELIPFVERTSARCVGIDIAAELGKVIEDRFPHSDRVIFVRADSSSLPFPDGTFDVVICRVALPYMDNRKTLSETARVLKHGGVFLLKTHSPRFYFSMIVDRLRTLSPRMLAYPTICLAAGLYHSLSGKQLREGVWSGKEIYQTERFLQLELGRNDLRIEGRLPDDNPLTPSYRIVKSVVAHLILFSQLAVEAFSS